MLVRETMSKVIKRFFLGGGREREGETERGERENYFNELAHVIAEAASPVPTG